MRSSVRVFGLCWLTAALMFNAHTGARAPQGSVAEGSIAGTVVDGDGQPVTDAQVNVRLADSSPSSASSATGASGAFVCEHLPPGRYLLSASKVGSVPMEYGATRPRGLGTPLVLPAGGILDHLTIRLPKGGVITGAVRRPDGSVVERGSVALFNRRIGATGREDWVLAASAQIDDRGVYRVSGLEPSTYAVRATSGAVATTAQSQEYAPTFYPGTTSIDNAEEISVGAAEEKPGIDLVLAQVSTVHVRGQLVGNDPSSVGPSSLRLDPMPSAGVTAAGFVAQVRAGRFEFTGVVPGLYVLRAEPTVSRSGDQMSASLVLSVGDQDLSDLNVVLHPSCVVTGRITAEDRVRAADLSHVRVGLRPEAGTGSGFSASAGGTALADGTFVIALDAGGQYRLVVLKVGPQPGPAPLVRSIVMDGREVSDVTIALDEGQRVSGILITLTDHLGTIAGSLTDRSGQPATKYTVVAFPRNRDLWGARGRRILAARPANNGEFVLEGLPAGEYNLAAVVNPDPNAWFVVSFLDTLVPGAVPVLVSNGATTTQDLRVTGSAVVHSISVLQ